MNFTASLLGASAGRNDQNADLAAGNDQFYARISANHSHGQDYKDGDGTPIPSGWDKWNADAALGWTPDADTLVELSAGAGDGWARYGRPRHGRHAVSPRQRGPAAAKEKPHALADQGRSADLPQHGRPFDGQLPAPPPAPGKMAMASNVKRVVTGGRIAATLQPTPALTADIGLDLQRNTHEGRSGMGMSYLNQPWVRDAKFANLGLFTELRWQAAPSTLWVGGLRLDRAQAWDYRNPASTGQARRKRPAQRLCALGAHAGQRSHHLRRPGACAALSRLLGADLGQQHPGNAFATLEPEKTTQLDVGANWEGAELAVLDLGLRRHGARLHPVRLRQQPQQGAQR